MTSTKLRLHQYLPGSTVNGPEVRAVFWLQGCTLACPGCWNPETHARHGGRTVPTLQILAMISRAQTEYGITGVTFSGGEPLQQAPQVFSVLRTVRALYPQLSLGMFSGYAKTYIQAHFPELAGEGLIDFIVAGRFLREAPTESPLVTSQNQELWLVTGKHTVSDFTQLEVEITIAETGLTQITGFPLLGLPNAP